MRITVPRFWDIYPDQKPEDKAFVLALIAGIPQVLCYDQTFVGDWAIVSTKRGSAFYDTDFQHPEPFFWTTSGGIDGINYWLPKEVNQDA